FTFGACRTMPLAASALRAQCLWPSGTGWLKRGRWRDVDRRGTSPRLCVWPHVLPLARIVVSGHGVMSPAPPRRARPPQGERGRACCDFGAEKKLDGEQHQNGLLPFLLPNSVAQGGTSRLRTNVGFSKTHRKRRYLIEGDTG